MQKITIKKFSKRPTSPWRVMYRAAGKEVTKWFKSERDANAYKQLLKDKLDGLDATTDLARACAMLVNTGVTLLECVKFALPHLQQRGLKPHESTDQACAAYLTGLKDGNRRKETIRSAKYAFKVFLADFGGRTLASITEKEFSQFLEKERAWKVEGRVVSRRWSTTTQKHYRTHLRTLWRAAGLPFPGQKWKPVNEDSAKPVFWSLRDVVRGLLLCPVPQRGALAIALFAGLRPFTVKQAIPEWFCASRRTISVPGSAMKTRKDARFHDVNPALFAWIAAYPPHPSSWRHLTKVLKAKGAQWHADVCRHTFATYLCASTDVEVTRKALGHATQELVERHYAGDTDKQSGLAFFNLTPASVYPNGDPQWQLPAGESVDDYLPAGVMKVAA